MKGRNSVMVGIRISDEVNTIMKGLADKKGLTVSAFIRSKVEELASKAVNTTKADNHSVNRTQGNDEVVNTTRGKIATKPVNTMKDVLIDNQGKRYKLIGGVRYAIKD